MEADELYQALMECDKADEVLKMLFPDRTYIVCPNCMDVVEPLDRCVDKGNEWRPAEYELFCPKCERYCE